MNACPVGRYVRPGQLILMLTGKRSFVKCWYYTLRWTNELAQGQSSAILRQGTALAKKR